MCACFDQLEETLLSPHYRNHAGVELENIVYGAGTLAEAGANRIT